jgi:hypothetical protein
VLDLGTGREREEKSFQQAYNRLATCLQLHCNSRTTPALLRYCPSTTRASRARSSSRNAGFFRRQGSVPAMSAEYAPHLLVAREQSDGAGFKEGAREPGRTVAFEATRRYQ